MSDQVPVVREAQGGPLPAATRPLCHDDLYAIPSPSDPRLSPDGRRVAFVVTTADRATDGYVSSVWIVDADGPNPTPRRLTYGPADSAPRWSPDGATIAFLCSVDEAPAQLWLLPVVGGEARRLTSLPGGVATPVWSPDGTAIAFTALVDKDATPAGDRRTAPVVVDRLDYKADGTGPVHGSGRQLFVVDVAGGDVRQLTAGTAGVSRPVWSPDGARLAYATADHADPDLVPGASLCTVGLVDGVVRRLTARPVMVQVVDWRDGELLVCGPLDWSVGHSRVYLLADSGGELRPVAPDHDRNVLPGNAAYPGGLPRFDGDRIVFCVRERGSTHVVAVPRAGGDVETLVGGDVVVSGLATRAGRLAYVAATSTQPSEVYVDGRQLTELFRTALPDVRLFRPRAREFVAPDGTPIDGWIVRGDVAGPTPLLLDVHGGPHNAWGPAADLVRLYHQTLVARGWTIAYVNSRGSDGYGERLYRAVSTQWGFSDEHDFLGALDALVADGIADPDRLAVTGYSYGGFMTCWLSARTRRFAAAVTGACVSNLVSMAGTSDLGRYVARFEGGADVHTGAEWLAERSPITYLDGARTPTLVLHGEHDDRCPLGQGEEWFAGLRNQGVPTGMVRYPGSSHEFIFSGRPSHRIDYNRRVEQWVTRYAGEPREPRSGWLSGF